MAETGRSEGLPVGGQRLGVVVAGPAADIPPAVVESIDARPELAVVARTESGPDAVEVLRRLPIHVGVVTLVGIGLAGDRDAYWLIRWIRESLPATRILACGTVDDAVSISRALFVGADGFVATSSGPAGFLEAILEVSDHEVVLQGLPPSEPELPGGTPAAVPPAGVEVGASGGRADEGSVEAPETGPGAPPLPEPGVWPWAPPTRARRHRARPSAGLGARVSRLFGPRRRAPEGRLVAPVSEGPGAEPVPAPPVGAEPVPVPPVGAEPVPAPPTEPQPPPVPPAGPDRVPVPTLPPEVPLAAVEPARVLVVGAGPSLRETVVGAGVPQEDVAWVPRVSSAEDLVLAHPGRASLLVVGPDVPQDDALGLAELAARASPVTSVVLVRSAPGEAVIAAAMRAGIRDVVDVGQGADALAGAVRRALARSAGLRAIRVSRRPDRAPEDGLVVSVFSSKGGVGKTFLAANLGLAIAQQLGLAVAVVDLAHPRGDLLAQFGMETDRSVEDLAAVGRLDSREAIVAAGLPVADRVTAYAAGAAAGTLTGPDTDGLLGSLRSAFPITVVDTLPRYSDSVLAALDLSDCVCLVTAPEVVGLRHLSLARETFRRLALPAEVLVVLNRTDSRVGIDPDAVTRLLGVPVDARIPSSVLAPLALNRGRPLYVDAPGSPIASAIGALAGLIVARATRARTGRAAGDAG